MAAHVDRRDTTDHDRHRSPRVRRREYLRALGTLPLLTVGFAGCLSDGASGPAERALTADELGEAWSYTESGSPTTTDRGTIVARYRASDDYPRTVRLRLWPCRGETLDALGGTCSLGNLPERQRANESVETADLSLGETAFAWWTDETTDIEVVAANHVFRLTHTPVVDTEGSSAGAIPSREARIDELLEIARLQTEKLARRTTETPASE